VGAAAYAFKNVSTVARAAASSAAAAAGTASDAGRGESDPDVDAVHDVVIDPISTSAGSKRLIDDRV